MNSTYQGMMKEELRLGYSLCVQAIRKSRYLRTGCLQFEMYNRKYEGHQQINVLSKGFWEKPEQVY